MKFPITIQHHFALGIRNPSKINWYHVGTNFNQIEIDLATLRTQEIEKINLQISARTWYSTHGAGSESSLENSTAATARGSHPAGSIFRKQLPSLARSFGKDYWILMQKIERK